MVVRILVACVQGILRVDNMMTLDMPPVQALDTILRVIFQGSSPRRPGRCFHEKENPATVLRPLILVLLIGGGTAYWLTHNRDKTNDHLAGYAEGEMVYVSSPIAGQLQDLKVQRGDQAQAGTELFGLEREEEREAMQQAEASLRESQTRLSKASSTTTAPRACATSASSRRRTLTPPSRGISRRSTM